MAIEYLQSEKKRNELNTTRESLEQNLEHRTPNEHKITVASLNRTWNTKEEMNTSQLSKSIQISSSQCTVTKGLHL